MNKKIIILSLELQDFKNTDTGVVNQMTKITYGIDLLNSDNFSGYSVMSSYAKGNTFEVLKKVLKHEVDAEIETKPGEKQNSVKYVITKINGSSVK